MGVFPGFCMTTITMKTRNILILFIFTLLCGSLHSQDMEEDMLLKRFRINKTLDSLQHISKPSAAERERIVSLKESLINIDNQLLRDYINEGTIDSRTSRLRMLLNENNRLKGEQEQFRKLTRTMYIILAVFLLASGVLGYLVFVLRRRWLTEQQARLEIQETYNADRSRYHQIEDKENELVDELKSELGSYKEELSKASRFLVNLRNEKIKLENELEELKEVHNKLKKDHRQVTTKLDKLRNKGDEDFEQLKSEKEEAEQKFNDLYKRYQELSSNEEAYKKQVREYEELLNKEKQERETVRQDLLGWIESKNDEIQQIKKARVRKERELRDIKEALAQFLKDVNKDQTLSRHLNLDMEDKDSIVNNIRALIQNKEDDLALTRKEKAALEEERDDLKMQVASLERTIQEARQDAEEKNELLNTEFSKRQKLEQQLHQMLNNLKNFE